MKKFLAVILTSIMLLSCVTSVFSVEHSLEVTSVEFNSETINSGGSVDITLSYEDNGFGVGYGEVEFRSLEYPEKRISCNLYQTTEESVLHGSIQLSKYYPSGKYDITRIFIYDKDGQYIKGGSIGDFTIPNPFKTDFTGVGFTYLNEDEADTIAPEITSVELNGDSFNAGDELIITIGFIETGSGFDGAAAHFVNEETLEEEFEIWSIYLDEDGYARGSYYIPDSIPSGNYSISYIAISDKADNNGVLEVRMPFQSENLAGADKCKFHLTSPGTPVEQDTKIQISSIALSKNVADIGDTVSVYLTGNTEFGELRSLSYGNEIRFENTVTNRVVVGHITNTDDPKVVKANIEIDEKTDAGDYVLADYNIYAQKGTSSYYAGRFYLYDLPETYMFLGFTVNGEKPSPIGNEGTGIVDTLPPRVKSISIDKSIITAPESAIITVVFENDFSGISSAKMCLHDSNGIERMIDLVPEDGNTWTGRFETSKYSAEDTFYMEYILAEDGAGNWAQLGATPRQGRAILPLAYRNIKVEIINSNQDAEAPLLNSISFKDASIVAPGKQEIIVDASDLVSGVSSVDVCVLRRTSQNSFVSDRVSLKNSYYDEATDSFKLYEDGKWHGFLNISQYAKSQTRYLDYVYLEDQAGNYKYYTSDSAYENYQELLPVATRYMSFDVLNTNGDEKAPVLESIEFSQNSIKAPGYVEIKASLSDDISGVKNARVIFEDYNNGRNVEAQLSNVYYNEKTGEITPYEDGMWHGAIQFGQYIPSGTYYFSCIYLTDYAENRGEYWANLPVYYNNEHLPEKFNKLGIEVLNPDDWSDVSTSTESSTFIQDIVNSDDDAYIVVNSTNNPNVPQDAFSAIQGTERTLEFISDGIKWTFNGADITNPKPVDLSFSYGTSIEGVESDNDAFSNMVGNTNSIVLHFADNGVLPGKACVAIKADYAMREYLGTKGLYIYYFNKTTKQLEPIASNITITSDYYIEFEITHCSDYVITSGAVHTSPNWQHQHHNTGTTNTAVNSPETNDIGIVLYSAMAISSILGMGYISGKKVNR